ncbi:MAG: hypothetical protein QXX35_05010 [Desulfurococcaceae archaeon]|uniref:Uncharacterized protein n=1 Tax=Staphylothermus marinus TaxID=2280 RepID=A0A7C4D7L5_STAMA
MKKIFVKLPNGNWIRVKGRLSGLTRSKSSKKTVYTLLAESVDKPDVLKEKPVKSFYISSARVMRYIYKLLDQVDEDNEELIIVIEYYNPEIYRVNVYNDEEDVAYKIALELGILKKI